MSWVSANNLYRIFKKESYASQDFFEIKLSLEAAFFFRKFLHISRQVSWMTHARYAGASGNNLLNDPL